ncbi:LysE family translocator [Actinokineospora iranica]|uniref:Threonine/homoserine/homoserine lactone efflux protein n=1 Tax=Actinokineospora iranica TaxID=1271860 RepID=A0A1G6JV76_9PSEU|nr:LysE family transporter [Actinokineospora iranica]SDC22607.1 Threonine/homoserine/homoserine lactone efflux protein [Actinokineospora iranica]
MGEILGLGLLLGVGAALSVGPIFVTILQEAAARGFGASLRVILGSATADLVLLLPALAFAWVLSAIMAARMWVGLAGVLLFVVFAAQALFDSRMLWRGGAPKPVEGWAFWKGVASNLANPLTWTFWVATGTPTMLRAQELGGWPGLAVFTVTWFVVASGLEAAIAYGVARSGKRVGARGQAVLTGVSALVFAGLAVVLFVRDVAPAVWA